MTARALVFPVFCLCAGPALADPTLECSVTVETQIEIVECLTAIDANVTAALEQVLSFARNAAEQLDADTGRPESVPALEASQAAWEAYRDAQCGYIGSTWAGGSGTGSAIGACRIELARDRIDALFASLP
jgi:uncharacterized protein YecT (DUF1311 family)